MRRGLKSGLKSGLVEMERRANIKIRMNHCNLFKRLMLSFAS